MPNKCVTSVRVPVNIIGLILIVELTNLYGSNLYQKCSLVNINLEWDHLVIDLKVPGEKTKSLWSAQTS